MTITQKIAAYQSANNLPHESLKAVEGQAPRAGLHPHMLLVRWEIAVRARDWSSALATAKALVAALPAEPIGWIYHAFAEQQTGHLQAARQTLLAGTRQFPNDWRLAYNLACYTAQLGDVAGAWNWLESAFALGDPAIIAALAAEEQSLKPLMQKARLHQLPASQPKTAPAAFAA